jgi:hypothetical protein
VEFPEGIVKGKRKPLVDHPLGTFFEERLPAREEERNPVRNEGPLQVDSPDEGGDGRSSGIPPLVAVARPDVDHGGDAFAELGPVPAGVDVAAIEHVRREGGIKAEHVERLVQEDAVELYKVLGGLAAPDEELAAPIARGDHARKGSQVAGEVGRGVGHGDEFEIGRPDRLLAGGDARRARLALGLHEHLIQRLFVALQGEIVRAVLLGGEDEGVDFGRVPHERSREHITAGRQAGQQIEAVAVGGGATEPAGLVAKRDVDEFERLPVGGIDDKAVQRRRLPAGRAGEEDQETEERGNAPAPLRWIVRHQGGRRLK